jgi:hypothetical protein
MNVKNTMVFLSLFLLVGCATVGNVQPVTGNTYTLTTSGHYKPWSELKASCVQGANEFCKDHNKYMGVVSWKTYGVRGWSPQEAELTFKCSAEPPSD